MDFTVLVSEELGIKTVYVKEINNYFEMKADKWKSGIYHISEEEFFALVKENVEDGIDKYRKIVESRKKINEKELPEYSEYNDRFVLCLHPSCSCNLACKYCFAQNEYLPKEKVEFEMIKKSIDFFIYDFAKNAKQYVIDLSGSGEPLLQFELLKKIEDYVNQKRNELGKDIMLMFCTNGTLIDEEKAKYLKEKSRIILGVSIDGNKKDNVNRVYKNQKESYQDVIRGIRLLAPKKVGLAVTFTKYNENVDEIFDSLSNIDNCDCVSIQNVRDFTGGEYSFEQVNLENIFLHYEKLCNNLIEHIKKGDFEYFDKLIKGSDYFGSYIQKVFYKGKLHQYRCSAGHNRIAIDNKGFIYTCSVMNGCEDFCIGNIEEGLDKNKIREFSKPVNTSEKCTNCWAAYICSGECNANAYYTHGKLYQPNDKLCLYRKKMIKLAITFWLYLQNYCSDKYQEAVKRIQRVSNFTVQDAGTWVTYMFMREYGISREYVDVLEALPIGNGGISPINIKNYLNKNMVHKFNSYEITDASYFDELSYPAIGYLNLLGMPYFSYCLLLAVEGERIKVKTMRNNEIFYISKEEFMKISNILIVQDS